MCYDTKQKEWHSDILSLAVVPLRIGTLSMLKQATHSNENTPESVDSSNVLGDFSCGVRGPRCDKLEVLAMHRCAQGPARQPGRLVLPAVHVKAGETLPKITSIYYMSPGKLTKNAGKLFEA